MLSSGPKYSFVRSKVNLLPSTRALLHVGPPNGYALIFLPSSSTLVDASLIKGLFLACHRLQLQVKDKIHRTHVHAFLVPEISDFPSLSLSLLLLLLLTLLPFS